MTTVESFRFSVVSQLHGKHQVIAPEKFRDRIEQRRWRVIRDKTRSPGRDLLVVTSVTTDGVQRNLPLHRYVMDLAGCCPAVVDHIDRDPLNNAEDNLRDGTRGNSINRSLQKNNKSGFVGVHFSSGRWRATVRAYGVRYHCGVFVSLEEAVAARERVAIATQGKFKANHVVP